MVKRVAWQDARQEPTADRIHPPQRAAVQIHGPGRSINSINMHFRLIAVANTAWGPVAQAGIDDGPCQTLGMTIGGLISSSKSRALLQKASQACHSLRICSSCKELELACHP